MRRCFLKIALLIWSLCLIAISSYAQIWGCTDPQADNYNAAATANDGSCVYPATAYIPDRVSVLDAGISETSALLFVEGFLWTINDGGHLPYLYKIDPVNGTLLDSVFVSNAVNNDWEALTSDGIYIYIGDFGNNYGDRTDLQILKIDRNALQYNDTVDAVLIRFSYPEQTVFTPALNNTPFDCEAFIAQNDSLYLFTKNWVGQYTSLYALPALAGTFEAQLRDSLVVEGLVTDAACDSASGNIVLLGYQQGMFNSYNSFAVLLFDYPDNRIFKGNKRRIALGSVLLLGQTEGVVLAGSTGGYLSGERIVQPAFNIDEPAKLHRFEFKPYFENGSVGIADVEVQQGISVYPNPSKGIFTIELRYRDRLRIYDVGGTAVTGGKLLPSGFHQIDLSHVPAGIYFLETTTQRIKLIKE